MAKTLVVAEKPSAGKDIARILGCTESHMGISHKVEKKNIG